MDEELKFSISEFSKWWILHRWEFQSHQFKFPISRWVYLKIKKLKYYSSFKGTKGIMKCNSGSMGIIMPVEFE